MAKLKVIHGKKKFHDNKSYRNLINYVTDPEKARGQRIVLRGVTSVEFAPMEMKCISEWNRNEGLCMRHSVLSFRADEQVDADTAKRIAERAADYYAEEYQMVAAVHENTENVHIHFAMNTVNYHTGRKYEGRKKDFYGFRSHVEQILCEVLEQDDMTLS